MLAQSLKKYGAGRSVLVDRKGRIIAGNKTVEQAKAAGLKRVVVVPTDGNKLVVVQRTDLDLNNKRAQELAIADNRIAEVDLEWNPEILAGLGDEIDMSKFWNEKELNEVLGEFAPEQSLEAPEPQLGKAAQLQKKWKTARGQIWEMGGGIDSCAVIRHPLTMLNTHSRAILS